MIYLIRISPHNESFILDSYATSLEGCKEIVVDYVVYITSIVNREEIVLELNNDTIEAKIDDCYGGAWSQNFYITAIDKSYWIE